MQMSAECPWCSTETMKIFHTGYQCPRVKAVEYYPDGRVKRVEYRDGYSIMPIGPAISASQTT